MEQSISEARSAANTAIANLEVTNATTKEQVLAAVTAVIKTSKYTAEWDSNNDFNKQDAEIGNPGSISGKILIKAVDGGATVATIVVDKEISALESE